MMPANYVTEIVLPTLREFRDDRGSRRRAYLACIVIFHIKDHLAESGELGIEEVMRTACGADFDVVRGVCNGVKHLTTRKPHSIRFTAGEDWYRPPAVADMMVVGLSVLGDETGGREISSGTDNYDLFQCARTVVREFQRQYPAHLSSCDLSEF